MFLINLGRQYVLTMPINKDRREHIIKNILILKDNHHLSPGLFSALSLVLSYSACSRWALLLFWWVKSIPSSTLVPSALQRHQARFSLSFPAILDPHFQLHPESSPEKVLLMQYVCSTIHFPPPQTSYTPSILSWLLVSPSSVPSGLDICSQSLNSVSFSFPPLPSLLSSEAHLLPFEKTGAAQQVFLPPSLCVFQSTSPLLPNWFFKSKCKHVIFLLKNL